MAGLIVTGDSLQHRAGTNADHLRADIEAARDLRAWLLTKNEADLVALGLSADDAYFIIVAYTNELSPVFAAFDALANFPKLWGMGSAGSAS